MGLTPQGNSWLGSLFDSDDEVPHAASDVVSTVLPSHIAPASVGPTVRVALVPSQAQGARPAAPLAHDVCPPKATARPKHPLLHPKPKRYPSPTNARNRSRSPTRSSTARVAGPSTAATGGMCDDWGLYQVHLRTNHCGWWEVPHGIFDMRAAFRTDDTAAEGTKLNAAFKACMWVLRKHGCQFKIGLASMLGDRWRLYRESSHKWQPTHMFILMVVCGREAAGFAEAGLIAMLRSCDFDVNLNINSKTCDRGGTGPRPEERKHMPHCIYLACRAAAV